jgi:hypothetical protein
MSYDTQHNDTYLKYKQPNGLIKTFSIITLGKMAHNLLGLIETFSITTLGIMTHSLMT